MIGLVVATTAACITDAATNATVSAACSPIPVLEKLFQEAHLLLEQFVLRLECGNRCLQRVDRVMKSLAFGLKLCDILFLLLAILVSRDFISLSFAQSSRIRMRPTTVRST